MPDQYAQFLNEHIETMPREQLLQLQKHRLKRVLDYAYKHSPLIESLWKKASIHPSEIHSLEDFYSNAPFFDKDDIRIFRDEHNDSLGGLGRLSNLDITKVATTSGTTGDPTPIPLRMRSSSDEGYARDYWVMGARPGDYSISCHFTFRIGIDHSSIGEAGLIPINFNYNPNQIPHIAAAIKKFKPTVFSLMSTPLMLGFAQWFEQSGVKPKELFAPLKGAFYGGEALSPRLKRLAASWGLELFETTSLGDVMSGTECREHNGFHAYEDKVIVECLEPYGDKPVAEGELGELVVTTLDNPELPFIRFRTDDLVVMNRERCACGSTHSRYHIRGRKSDQITVQGKTILPLDLRFIIEEQQETQAGLFQIIKTSVQMNTLALRVGYKPEALTEPPDKLIERLQQLISTAINVPTRIELTPEEELLKLGPPHKIPRVTKA